MIQDWSQQISRTRLLQYHANIGMEPLGKINVSNKFVKEDVEMGMTRGNNQIPCNRLNVGWAL